jgi:hypothetical protein
MKKWELTSRYSPYLKRMDDSSIDPTVIWEEKDKKTGKTVWDELQALASQGWELVSVTPLNTNG